MSLEDRVRAARERADTSIDPHDHAVKNAMDAALAAECQPEREPSDLTGIEPWSAVSKPGTVSRGPCVPRSDTE